MHYVYARIGTQDDIYDLVLQLPAMPEKGDCIVLTRDCITVSAILMMGVTIRVLRVSRKGIPAYHRDISAKILYEVIKIPEKKGT